ncbi:putative exported protein [Lysobacter dokdonensis DS-58]|uniref:Putative exported protein n=1 Tax=Lysobacter dokdonensis DS-58 TaxID=1300345 RepID=A0A0A2WDA5_9GAMM|nr:hypothetical protein [Lysobacter dokdonensis]KGQ18176.1 putative exported protein [Lysobacter dokdonensis DS-58]
MHIQRKARTRMRRDAFALVFFAAASPAALAQQANATFATPVDNAALDAQRGGDGTLVNTVDIDIDLDGTVDGNTAIDNVTGQNLIDGGSFANNAGIATVIQNSGNNVLIQNGMAVSVQFLGATTAAPP